MNISYTTSYTTTGLIAGVAELFLVLRTEKDSVTINSSLGIERNLNVFKVFALNVTVLGLLQAIYEGAINHLVVAELFGKDDLEKLSDKQVIFRNFVRDRLELDGSAAKGDNFFFTTFSKTVQDIIGSDLHHSVNHLRTLRNTIAHGTSFVFPDSPLPDSASDVYPYSWQKRLQKCSDYLDANLKNSKGLTEHLKNPELPFHFCDCLIKASESFVSAFPDEEKHRFFKQITTLNPGYVWSPPRKL